jgi:hypothetical protein
MMMDADLTGGMVDRLMDGMRENVTMCEDVMEMCVSCVTLSETRRASPSGRELVSVWIVIRVMCAAERGGAFWCVSLFVVRLVCALRALCVLAWVEIFNMWTSHRGGDLWWTSHIWMMDQRPAGRYHGTRK